MLSTTYQLPGALVLVIGGLVACFAGYRLFRLVLGIYGFILGALAALSMVAPGSTVAMIVALIVGGVIGAAILTLAYFVGVALVGAGLGTLVVHAAWTQLGWGSPYALPVLVAAAVGAVVAVVFQRYVIIDGTAFGGAWTAIVGATAALGIIATPRATNLPARWSTYMPDVHVPDLQGWLMIVWLVLGTLGILVQLQSPRRRR